MVIRPVVESKQLKILRLLNNRMNLSTTDKNYYINLEKGYEGEKIFEKWLEKLSNEYLILNSLLFEVNKTLFQVDTLIITNDLLYFIEVKNNAGDHFIENDKWYSMSGREVKDPLLQLKRSSSLLRRLLQELGSNLSLDSHVTFVNPTFTLYQTPMNVPIIFPTQINRFINQLNSSSKKLNNRHIKLAELLLSRHIEDSPYTNIPEYTYDQLKKGVTCELCHSFDVELKNSKLICDSCSHIEDSNSVILRSVVEIKLLFPDMKITTNAIYEWCRINISKRTISRILGRNFSLRGKGKTSCYVDKKSGW